MKRKLLVTLLAVTGISACAFGLSACGGDKPHEHNWSQSYAQDGDRHYRTCDGCDEKNYGEHDFSGGNCVCGYKDPSGEELLTTQKDKAVKFINEKILPEVSNGKKAESSSYYLSVNDDCEVTGAEIISVYHSEQNAFGEVFGTIELAKVTFKTPAKARDIINGTATVSIDIQRETVFEFNAGENNDDNDITDAVYASENKESSLKIISGEETKTSKENWTYRYITFDDGAVTCCEFDVNKGDGSKDEILYALENGYKTDTKIKATYPLGGTNILPLTYSFGDAHAAKYDYKEVDGGYEITKAKDTGITELIIPDVVVSIESRAFSECYWLKTVVVPESVVNVGDSAFGSGVENFTAPISAFKALNNLSALKTAVITSGEQIDDYMFRYQCTNLESITLPETLKIIGEGAFGDCKSLKSIEIPYGVTFIKARAFINCAALTSISLPESLTEIGYDAFNNCALTEIIIPESIAKIDESAFNGCNKLKSVTAPAHGIAVGKYTETITISSGTEIAANRFNDMRYVKNIILPETLTKIGAGAFSGCRALESITLPVGITVLEEKLFKQCYNLSSVNFKGTITEIKSNAFQSCTSLTEIVLPTSLITVSFNAFIGCIALTAYCEPESKPSGWNFGEERILVWNCKNNDVATDGNIYVMQDGLRYALNGNTAYVVTQPSNLSGRVVIAANVNYKGEDYPVTVVKDNAFFKNTNISDVVIGDNVTALETWAFRQCSGICSVTVGAKVNTIKAGAFYYCTGIKEVYYNGTKEDFTGLKSEVNNNTEFTEASRYYYSATKPTSSGYYWHYDADGNVVKWNLEQDL